MWYSCSTGGSSAVQGGGEILKKHKTKIMQTHPQIYIMHPINYQSVPVQNKVISEEYEIGQNVKVVIHNENVFLV